MFFPLRLSCSLPVFPASGSFFRFAKAGEEVRMYEAVVLSDFDCAAGLFRGVNFEL